MKVRLLFLCVVLFNQFTIKAQSEKEHTIKVEIIQNAFMCPNLSMKLNRTIVQREKDMHHLVIADDYNSATFTTPNSSICNMDSVVKIFVKESEFPFHIFQSIQIDGVFVYKKVKK